MTRRLSILLLSAALAGLPAAAQAQGNSGKQGEGNSKLFGHLLGAGVGALLGSQIGGGKGKIAAVAVGALAGAWLGGEIAGRLTRSDQEGIAQTTGTALETGEPQTWTNPDTGVQTRVSVKDHTVERAPIRSEGLRSRPWETPPLSYENAWYRASSDSNVRSGPGTDYSIMGSLRRGERVAVVGRVRDANWYMVADGGLGEGFVHGSLLQREGSRAAGAGALQAQARSAAVARPGDERACSIVSQQITLPDGTSEARDMRACKRADGTWEIV
jgi:surface antigen